MIDVSGEDYGYIVSHQTYGQSDYRASRSWTLTLEGFKSSKVEIEFERLALRKGEGECYDYLQISSSSQICMPAGKITVDLSPVTSKSIIFNFVTSNRINRAGFWLQYKGMLKL